MITPNADTAFDCVQENTRQTHTVAVADGVLTQKFLPCLTGQLTSITLPVSDIDENVWFMAEIVDPNGSALDAMRFTHRDVIDGKLFLDVLANVKENVVYGFQVTASHEGSLEVGFEKNASPGGLYLNSAKVEGAMTAAFGYNLPKELPTQVAHDRGENQPGTRAIEGQCKTTVGNQDGTVLLKTPSHSIYQSFQACANGELTTLRIELHSYTPNFSGQIFIESEDGTVTQSMMVDRNNIDLVSRGP